MTYKTNCKLFTGYKPCRFKRSCDGCPYYEKVGKRFLIISLEAMGAVLRSTCILKAIRRLHADAHITWLTMPASKPLLAENPFIDRILSFGTEVLPIIDHLEFDTCFVVDKSQLAGSLAAQVKAKNKKGFGVSPNGFIEPLNQEAQYQYDVGLSDQLKFFENSKPETQQITESLGLEWQRDSYVLELNLLEQQEVARRRQEMIGTHKGILGFSTGCSTLYPYKKFSLDYSIEVVKEWRRRFPDYVVALFGGPEDTLRNNKIKDAFLLDELVVNTPTTEGLRSGIMWMDSADMILSGCSLGLHIAVGLKKKIITWFGVSCAQEIDLYGLGVKLLADVNCSPCWKKSCDEKVKCYDLVSMDQLMSATSKNIKSLSFKR